MRQNSKFVVAAFGATNVTTLTASIDTRGFSYARIYCIANSTAAVHTTGSNNILQQYDKRAPPCDGGRLLCARSRQRAHLVPSAFHETTESVLLSSTRS